MTKAIIESVKSMLANEGVQEQFRTALKENADIFRASIIELVSNDSYLADCEPGSIVRGALALATAKLPINKNLGFAYLVPYREKGIKIAQPQIGYKGLIQLAQRTGEYKCINAGVVYDGELRSVDKLTGEVDLTGEKKSDNVIGYFAYFSTKYGFEKCLYWTKEQVTKHASRFSKSFNSDRSNPWKTDFDAMGVKTVLKSLISHYGPMTIETGTQISKMEEPDETGFDIEIEPEENHFEALAAAVKKPAETSCSEIPNDSAPEEITDIKTGIDLLIHLVKSGRKEEDVRRTLKNALEKDFEALKPEELESAKKIFDVATVAASINDFE